MPRIRCIRSAPTAPRKPSSMPLHSARPWTKSAMWRPHLRSTKSAGCRSPPKVVTSNRGKGPEAVLELARATHSWSEWTTVAALISRAEIDAITRNYQKVAGFDRSYTHISRPGSAMTAVKQRRQKIAVGRRMSQNVGLRNAAPNSEDRETILRSHINRRLRWTNKRR